MRIVVATKNKGKIKEIQHILKDLPVQVLSQDDLDIKTDVEETGSTFEENALIKAREIQKMCNEVTIADDSGLEVDYLNGAPGIYTARYAGEGATDIDKMNKLIKELDGVPLENRTARFVCAIAAVFPDGKKIVVRGECEGLIAFEPVGEKGFGYDPLFYLPQYQATMAQIEDELKNTISHRAKALALLKKELYKLD
ncbi:XTP/dITP diphosphatase [Petroclostridium sp. X23]|jgi:XTP/dITP diphosphohydrolase|uniref:XTP/dITP diphosphatase n=1 Tax=Petroclostridium sp. X23 TaxID=3045146 RepID=UPI0024ADA692|nr:XTP/dITP diphosphatase [Petroclostridium sp. X23]WHH60528.1 XTP/dITP diphosphatase [Petroclostridium sp. X23]